MMKYLLYTILILLVSCSNSETKKKELDLKEKELEIRNKELDLEKAKLTKVNKDSIKKETEESAKEVNLNYEFNSGTPGIIKDIFKRDDVTHITVDFVQVKLKPNTINDFYVINTNKKLRTFVVNSGTIIYDCLTNHKIKSKNIFAYRKKLINYDNNLPFIFDTENGKITELNLICYN